MHLWTHDKFKLIRSRAHGTIDRYKLRDDVTPQNIPLRAPQFAMSRYYS